MILLLFIILLVTKGTYIKFTDIVNYDTRKYKLEHIGFYEMHCDDYINLNIKMDNKTIKKYIKTEEIFINYEYLVMLEFWTYHVGISTQCILEN